MGKSHSQTRSHSLDAPEGPLAEHLGAFESLLNGQGYAQESSRRHLGLIADFSVWLTHKRMSIEEVTRETAQRYLGYRAHHRCHRKGAAYALRRFVQLLQENGIVARDAPVAQTSVEKWVNEYSLYLHQERGLAATTIRRYKWCARLFLTKQFGNKATRFSDLSAQEIIGFVQHEVAQNPSRAQKMTTALRSLLQYARYRGFIS
jgi:site-specific recombinase XerD